MKSLRIGSIFSLILIGILMAACGLSGAIESEVEESSQKSPEAAGVTERPEPKADIPTPRAELMASDPASISLPSGRLTLVEFFAYW